MIKTYNTEQYRNKTRPCVLTWLRTPFYLPFRDVLFQFLTFHTWWLLRGMGCHYDISDNYLAVLVLWYFVPEQHFIHQTCYLNKYLILFSTGVHAWVVTEWCLQWLPPGEHERDDWRNIECKMFSTSSVFVVPTHTSFTPTWVSVEFMCPSNYILDISKNILMLTLWFPCKERESYSNIPNISQTRSKQGLLLRDG